MTRVRPALARPERLPLDVALSALPSVPRPTLARMTRMLVSSDGEDEGTIILPAPKGVEPTRWQVS